MAAATLWSQLVIVAEVAGAMALGGLIGFERELAHRPAGFRTHMLVAGACALFVGLGGALLDHFSQLHAEFIQADPFRLLAGVVAALGFIGAGTIFREQGHGISGLTTAASLLFSGAIGVAAALQQWFLAIGATLLALIVLFALRFIEQRLHSRGPGNDS
jgi:putative Mg2+ transporter-C (MgtC) family protein